MSYADLFFNKEIFDVDKTITDLIDFEEIRQKNKIILIPSESITPMPVRKALASAFTSVYAEGYPPKDLLLEDEETLKEYFRIIAHYRRYSDRRFYKGCEYVNFLEVLAQKRVAKLFQTGKYPAEYIYANVQPLSGAAANTAVYDAFVNPGDTVMGMSLMHGGHLTHGSEFNRSGKNYNIVSYEVDPKTEQLDYDSIYDLAQQHRPKMIIAGYTSYPWAPDWKKFHEIAKSIDAILFADISHPAGLVVAGMYPNPIDYADVVTFTTHKTMFGPRGAVILTTNPDYAEQINQAIFPGEQGGPHVNKFAAMAVAFKIAETSEFKETQRQIVENARLFSSMIEKNGIRLAYGGTDTHLFVIDLKSINTNTGFVLKGEIAVRVLDACGIVTNKNTIPGDLLTPEATGVRMGTPWITQREITEEGLQHLADAISLILKNIKPFEYNGLIGRLPRGKISLSVLDEAQQMVKEVVSGLKSESDLKNDVYEYHPHEMYEIAETRDYEEWSIIVVEGERAYQFIEESSTQKVSNLKDKEILETLFFNEDDSIIAHTFLMKIKHPKNNDVIFVLLVKPEEKVRLVKWLGGLSDGYIEFNKKDIYMKVEGPVIVREYDELCDELKELIVSTFRSSDKISKILKKENNLFKGLNDIENIYNRYPEFFDIKKPYFIGHEKLNPDSKNFKNKRIFNYKETNGEVRKSILYEEHKKLGAIMVDFAGWKMPVRYEGIIEEHVTVRNKAGLFDISHMGVFLISGPHATSFLDAVTSNYVQWLKVGESQYSYLLDPEGNVIDDIMVYKLNKSEYLIVVNAVNEFKDFSWLSSINSKEYIIDRKYPFKEILEQTEIINLKDEKANEKAKVNLAIQGPNSRDILLKIIKNENDKIKFLHVKKTEFIHIKLSEIDTILARTGYTGEDIGYEILVHPDSAPKLWRTLLEVGEDFGLKPIGLGARDSLRIEAGLPLYGHELAGPHNISPIEAGFAPYVKLHKPFFIGRDAIIEKINNQKFSIVRFQMKEKGVKMIKSGDLVVSRKSQKVIGFVTSNAVNGDGIQVGLALVDKKMTIPGYKIALIPLSQKEKEKHLDFNKINFGEKVPLSVEAEIVSRFLNR